MDKRLQKGIIAVFLANAINVLFSLATNFLLPKFLSVESYAGIKEFQLYVSYVGLFHFGFVDGIYLKYGGKTLGKTVDKSFATDLSTMTVFQLIISCVTLFVAVILKDKILVFFALSILPQNMGNYFKFLYQATGEFTLYGKAKNLTTISTFALNMFLLFVVKTDDIVWYVLGYVVLYFGVWIVLEVYFRAKHTIEKGNLFLMNVLLDNVKSGFLLTLGNLSSIFLTSMDRWFVKGLMDTLAFAQYSFAVSVENFLNLAITPVTTTLYNYFCREERPEAHKDAYNYVALFAVVVPAAAFPVKFILKIFLINYIDANSVIFFLFSAQIFYTIIRSIYVNLYKVQRKQKVYFTKLIFVLLVGFITNCACFAVVHVKESFAVGTLISAIVWYFISETDFRYLKIKIKTKAFLFVELLSFLFFGLKVDSAVYGCIAYMLITIIMSFVLMQDTMIKIYNILRKKYQRSINE